MAEDLAVEIKQWHTLITRRADGSYIRIVGEQAQRLSGSGSGSADRLPRRKEYRRCSSPSRESIVPHPESQRLESALLFDIFGNPSAMGV